jgi:hypothetical protein
VNTRGGRALAEFAKVLARIDPDRAARLADDAERIAQSITSPGQTVMVLACIVRALAQIQPERAARLADDAERIARSITDERERADVLALAADVLAPIDPGRAARLTADAERAAESISDEHGRTRALLDLVKVLAKTDPDRAERAAWPITDEDSRVSSGLPPDTRQSREGPWRTRDRPTLRYLTGQGKRSRGRRRCQ